MTERERQVMKKLKEVVDKQRDEIRAKDRELTLKNEDVEAVRSYVLPEQNLFSHCFYLKKTRHKNVSLFAGKVIKVTPYVMCGFTLKFIILCMFNASQMLLNFFQLQQQLNRLMKINHDLRHKITVVEAQGKALIEQKVELEASGQARQQELGNLRQEVVRLKERLKEQGKISAETEEPVGPPSPAQVRECK